MPNTAAKQRRLESTCIHEFDHCRLHADLVESLEAIVRSYIRNPGTEYEFITTKTIGKRGSGAGSDGEWARMDAARAILRRCGVNV